MLVEFPTQFPLENISACIGMIRDGSVKVRPRTFGQHLYTVQGYAMNLLLTDAAGELLMSAGDKECLIKHEESLAEFADLCAAYSAQEIQPLAQAATADPGVVKAFDLPAIIGVIQAVLSLIKGLRKQ